MKNIQVIDGAVNCTYDIFAATEDDFLLIFPPGEDIAFIDEVIERVPAASLHPALERLWITRVPKAQAVGIHGTLFYGLESKKPYFPRRVDEDARNPDGSRLR